MGPLEGRYPLLEPGEKLLPKLLGLWLHRRLPRNRGFAYGCYSRSVHTTEIIQQPQDPTRINQQLELLGMKIMQPYSSVALLACDN